MNIFFLDKNSTNFQPKIPQTLKVFQDSWDLLKYQNSSSELILGSSDPKFFFDATLWLLDHQCYAQSTLKALTPILEDWQKIYIQSCPFFHLHEQFLPIETHNTGLELSLFQLWRNLSQPWDMVSSQFAQLYQQNNQPWLLGLNSWLYRERKDDYFSALYENLTSNFHHTPWAQYFKYYYQPLPSNPIDLFSLTQNSLGPYAQISLLNHYLPFSQNSTHVHHYLNSIQELYTQPLSLKPHRLDLMMPTLLQLFSQSKNQIYVYEFFEKIFKPMDIYQEQKADHLTYHLAQAFLDQNFTQIENLVKDFYPQGLHLNQLQAHMMDYMHQHYQVFGSFSPLIDYYKNQKAS